jgi:hypothetical protein
MMGIASQQAHRRHNCPIAAHFSFRRGEFFTFGEDFGKAVGEPGEASARIAV